MTTIEYCAPTSIGEAVARLAARGDRARPLAGGTDLLKQLDEGPLEMDLVVDITQIPELNVLQFDPTEGLTIGAAVPWCRISEHADVRARYPCLALVAHLVRSISVEGRTTLGGHLCTNPGGSDALPALIALEASCDIAGPEGRRTALVEKLWAAPERTTLGRGEMLVSIHLPAPRPSSGAWYIPFHPNAEMEVVYVRAAASLALTEDKSTILAARVALGAAAPMPLLLDTIGAVLVGQPPSEALLNTAAALARLAARTGKEQRDDAAQRAHAFGLLTRRALQFALIQAKQRRTTCGHTTPDVGAGIIPPDPGDACLSKRQASHDVGAGVIPPQPPA